MTCILVVDDEPAVLKVLVTRLNLAGYQVLSAQDGEQALEVFHKEAPDLVVLDVMLPKMDGFAVCRRIRAESCVPIIFLTALEAISENAIERKTGARGLRAILEQLLLELMYDIPGRDDVSEVVINGDVVRGTADPVLVIGKDKKSDKSA